MIMQEYPLSSHSCIPFNIKNLGQVKYFFRVEITRSKEEILLSHRKYVLDLLAETEKLRAKPCNIQMVQNVHLTKNDGDPLDDPEKYRRLVGKLNYLNMTHLNIAYHVSVVS